VVKRLHKAAIGVFLQHYILSQKEQKQIKGGIGNDDLDVMIGSDYIEPTIIDDLDNI